MNLVAKRRHKPAESRARVLDYITEFTVIYGYPPQPHEIARGLGMGSVESVSYHLRILKADGVIEWDGGHARTIRVIA